MGTSSDDAVPYIVPRTHEQHENYTVGGPQSYALLERTNEILCMFLMKEVAMLLTLVVWLLVIVLAYRSHAKPVIT